MPVRQLAERLRSAGLRVWFDEWFIEPDVDVFDEFEVGVERSRTLALCMSREAFGSDWIRLERSTATFRNPQNKDRRFIPVLLEDCELPDTVRHFAYIDWRTDHENEFARLVNACQEPKKESKAITGKEAELTGHWAWISSIETTSDNKLALTSSWDGNLILWDLDNAGTFIHSFLEHKDRVNTCAISPTNKLAVSASNDKTLKIWDIANREYIDSIYCGKALVQSLAFMPDGKSFLAGDITGGIRLWDVKTRKAKKVIRHEQRVNSLKVFQDGTTIVTGSQDKLVRICDLNTKSCIAELKGHEGQVRSVAISPDQRFILSASVDSTVRLWEVSTRRCVGIFEGHSNVIDSVSFSADNTLAISSGHDGARIWRIPSGECLFNISEAFGVAAFTPDAKRLLTGMRNGRIYIWPRSIIPKSSLDSIRYTNAKVVLLGESGVGKTGLANRLVSDRYEGTDSTHGMKVERIILPNVSRNSIEREVWLWDLAGQDDYRLIHQLFLDETAVALMVINPQADDPFERVGDWLKALRAALKNADHDPARLLVAARTDRGGVKVSEDKINRFLEDYGFSDWISTSSKTGENCSDSNADGQVSLLKDLIAKHIPWNQLPFISTDRLLRELKNAVIERATNYDVSIVRFPELLQQMVTAFPNELIDPLDVRKAVRLIGNQGLIKPLDFGDLILLRPELMNDYAAAVIRAARSHTDEIGCVPEHSVLNGDFDLSGVLRLEKADELLLLRAMAQLFLDRSLCIAEDTIDGRQLIFPSQFRRDRPITKFPETIVIYAFGGELPTIFTTLVVRLWYSRAFDNKEIWQNAAEFLTKGNSAKIGFIMEKTGEGLCRLSVFADSAVSDDQKVIFIEYVHQHLLKNAIDLVRERRYVCNNQKCSKPVTDTIAVRARLEAGKSFITCNYCDKKVPLIDVIEKRAASDAVARRVREMDDIATAQLDNQAREQILIGHMMAICGEANQIFRPTTMFDYGIDGEVEFKGNQGQPSGKKIYVQLKSGDSFLRLRKQDKQLIFDVQNERHIKYWQEQPCDVYLVIRTFDGDIRWMNLSNYLSKRINKESKQIIFTGERLDAFTLMRMRDEIIPMRAK